MEVISFENANTENHKNQAVEEYGFINKDKNKEKVKSKRPVSSDLSILCMRPKGWNSQLVSSYVNKKTTDNYFDKQSNLKHKSKPQQTQD